MVSSITMSLPIAMSLPDLGLTEKDAQYILGAELHARILQILAWGMYTTIYSVAIYLTLSRDSPKLRSAIIMTVIWLFVSVQTITRWIGIQNDHIRHGESRETQITAGFASVPLGVAGFIMSFLSVVLTDLTMIWRCWILHGKRWTIIIIPVLSLTVAIVTGIIRGIWSYTDSKETVEIATWDVTFLSATVFTNIFCTATIIYRVVDVNGFSKSFKRYRGVLEILIESAFLYTAIYLLQIGLTVYTSYFTDKWDYGFSYAQALCNIITGVAPTLIIARVAAGHARPDDTWTSTASLPGMTTTLRSVVESLRFVHPQATEGPSSETDVESGSLENDPATRRTLGE